MPADFPMVVKKVRDVLIPMRDGVQLAANLYLPEKPGKYPGIFSFYPYLKDGWIGISHEPHHQYFASQGYAVMQVDFRGTGASGGINPYVLDLQERMDGYDIVEWMAEQAWCSGSVGIWGISYGGITALSIASTQPPHLQAIAQISGTFDNYEWLFRTHGCRGLLLADVDWGTRMAACNLLPPMYQDQEGRWEDLWRERLEANNPWFLDWHGEPPDTDHWLRRRIELNEIKVPTFAICGWYDAYTAPAFRVFDEVDAPTRVLMGPWKHTLPDISPVVPIGGAHEIGRWWDRWLKGVANGVEDEPPVAIYVQVLDEWRYETEWPIARTSFERLYLSTQQTLSADAPSSVETTRYQYDSRVGSGSISYNGHRVHLQIPDDQSFDDHASLAYTGQPLEEDLELTGEPKVQVVLSASTDELTLVAKLCIVSPDGKSRVISRGNANPARKDAHAVFTPLDKGERRRVDVSMHPTSIVVRKGERLRLCLAGADFPELWPTPRPYDMEIHSGQGEESWVQLPIVPLRSEPILRPEFEAARTDLSPPETSLEDPDSRQQYDIVHQRLDKRVTTFKTQQSMRNRVESGTVLYGLHSAIVTTDADRPGSTNLRTDSRFELDRPTGAVSVRVRSLLTHFNVNAKAEIKIDGELFWENSWRKDIDDWIR